MWFYFYSEISIISIQNNIINYSWIKEQEKDNITEFKSLAKKNILNYELNEIIADKNINKSLNEKKVEIRNEKLNKILDNEVVKLIVSNFEIDKGHISFEEVEDV